MQQTTPLPDPVLPENPAQPNPPVKPPIVQKKSSLIPLLLIGSTIIVLLAAFPKVQTIISQAAAKKCSPISKVMFSLGAIDTFTNSSPTNISVLAYDQYNRPLWQGVKYDWGISSINSVGTVKAKHDLATFFPLRDGAGDLYVKTTNNCTPKSIIGSVKITVSLGVAPSPTMRDKK